MTSSVSAATSSSVYAGVTTATVTVRDNKTESTQVAPVVDPSSSTALAATRFSSTEATMSSQMFAVIVGCSIAVAVLLTLIIIVTIYCIVLPVVRRRRKTHSRRAAYAPEIVYDPNHHVADASPSVYSIGRPTWISSHPEAKKETADVRATNAGVNRGTSYVEATGKPTADYCARGNFYYSGGLNRQPSLVARQTGGGRHVDEYVERGAGGGGSFNGNVSLNDSCTSISSTTPLTPVQSELVPIYKHPSRPPKNVEQAVHRADVHVPSGGDLSRKRSHTAYRSTDDVVVTSQDGDRRRANVSQKSDRALTEAVWNATVDNAFDSALSVYEPM